MENKPKEENTEEAQAKVKPNKKSAFEGGTIITKTAKSKASLLPKREHVNKPASVKRHSQTSQTNDFGSQPVNFSKFVFMPEGYEKIFLTLYFLLVPYIVGLIFLYFFVAHTNITNFTSMNLTMFVVVWAIGYEIVGSIILIMIFYSAFSFKKRPPQTRTKTRVRDNSSFPTVHKLS